jgi:type III secretion protein HrpB1
MSTTILQSDDIGELGKALVEAITDARLDEAELILERLNEVDPSTEEYLIFPVIIAIQRGFIAEALQYLNSLGEDKAPELKAVCLYILGDPLWHSQAQEALQSDDPHTRQAMRELMQLDTEPVDAVATDEASPALPAPAQASTQAQVHHQLV